MTLSDQRVRLYWGRKCVRVCVRALGSRNGLCVAVSTFLIQPTTDHHFFPFCARTLQLSTVVIFTRMFTFSSTHTLESHHLKEVYTRDRSIKGTFEAQSKATSQRAVRQRSVRSRACHLASQYRGGVPRACLCFPNHSRTGNQTPAFRGKQTLSLSFFVGFFFPPRKKLCASTSCF